MFFVMCVRLDTLNQQPTQANAKFVPLDVVHVLMKLIVPHVDLRMCSIVAMICAKFVQTSSKDVNCVIVMLLSVSIALMAII